MLIRTPIGAMDITAVLIANDYPMVFISKDGVGRLYLGTVTETEPDVRVILVPATESDLVAFQMDETNLHDLVRQNRHRYILDITFDAQGIREFRRLLSTEVNLDDLPDSRLSDLKCRPSVSCFRLENAATKDSIH